MERKARPFRLRGPVRTMNLRPFRAPMTPAGAGSSTLRRPGLEGRHDSRNIPDTMLRMDHCNGMDRKRNQPKTGRKKPRAAREKPMEWRADLFVILSENEATARN